MKKNSESKDFQDYYQTAKTGNSAEPNNKPSKLKVKLAKAKKKVSQPLQGSSPDHREEQHESQTESRNQRIT